MTLLDDVSETVTRYIPYDKRHAVSELIRAYQEDQLTLRWYREMLMCRFGPEVDIREGQVLYGRRFIEDKDA